MLARLSESSSRYAVALGHGDHTLDVEAVQAFLDASYQYIDDVLTAGTRINVQRLQDLQALHESSMSAAKSTLDSLGQQLRHAEAEYTQRANRVDVTSDTAMLDLTLIKSIQDPETSAWQGNGSDWTRPCLPSALDALRSTHESYLNTVQSEIGGWGEVARATRSLYDAKFRADSSEANSVVASGQVSSSATANEGSQLGRKRRAGHEVNVASDNDSIEQALMRSPVSQSHSGSKRRKLYITAAVDQ